MPWCRTCTKLVADEDVLHDEEAGRIGRCPECGEPFPERKRAAWHFKLVLAASVVYLGYRAYQGITWLAHHV